MTREPAVSPALMRFAKSANDLPPAHFGTRYDATGRFLPEPGNTVVCHLEPGSATEAALAKARARLMTMPDAGQLAFTPLASLHMTLFQGIIEGRRRRPYWPDDQPLETAIDEMTRIYGDRLADFPGGPDFSVRVAEALPTGLTVVPASAADDAALRIWRDALAKRFGYRHPDHDSYVFHITFAYVIDWLDDAELPAWQEMFDELVETIAAQAPVLQLRPPAFCSFEDMNHFEELLVLAPAAEAVG
ncbi:DUF1868 domain-containing protein [Devosia sp.]|uniref:DUF1868 domain-containing protein n=1 Tax=Devosia sp. TaxID=1871048 RepID=UPI003A95CFDA